MPNRAQKPASRAPTRGAGTGGRSSSPGVIIRATVHRAAVLLVLLAGAGLAAQSGDVPAFEVVSVKRTKPDATGGGGGVFPGGRVAYLNVPLRCVIATAYQ